MQIKVTFYRKETPEEYLKKFEPILLKLGIHWHQLLGSIQPLLEEKGVKVLEGESDTSEITHILFTDEKN